jgi:hypothetical protein
LKLHTKLALDTINNTCDKQSTQEDNMTAITLSGYIVRETDAAVAFVALPIAGEHKPLWVPRSKIVALTETDGYSVSVQLVGEAIRRMGVPVDLEIDAAFAKRVKVIT